MEIKSINCRARSCVRCMEVYEIHFGVSLIDHTESLGAQMNLHGLRAPYLFGVIRLRLFLFYRVSPLFRAIFNDNHDTLHTLHSHTTTICAIWTLWLISQCQNNITFQHVQFTFIYFLCFFFSLSFCATFLLYHTCVMSPFFCHSGFTNAHSIWTSCTMQMCNFKLLRCQFPH